MSAAKGVSSSTVTSRQEEQRDAHAKLILRLAGHMGGQEIKTMKEYLLLRQTITGKQYEELDGLPAIVHCLEMLGVINIFEKDGYKFLIETFEAIDQHARAKQVKGHQDKFCRHGDDLSSREAEPTTSEQPAREPLPESCEADVEDQFQDIHAQLASNNENIAGLTTEKEQLMRQAEEYQRELTAKENDCKRFQEELDTSKKEIGKLKDQSRDIQAKLASKNENIAGLTTEKEQHMRQAEEYQRELTAKENDRKRLQEELDTSKKEIEKLKLSVTGSDEVTLKIRTIAWGLLVVVVIFAIGIGKIHGDSRSKDQSREKETLLERFIAGLTTEKEQLMRQTKEYQRKLTANENDCKRLQEELGTSKNEIEKLKGREGVQLAKGPRDIERCREVFTKEYGTHIQSIVNLGNRFAVAYWGQSYKTIEGVDIYDTSGVKQQTLKNNIEGLRHLAVTPDKWMVAVCVKGRDSYTIRLFDPVSGGYITSTPQFKLDGRVERFDVCDGRQFVILHDDLDKMTVVGEDGSVVLTDDVKYFYYSISCGGRHVFLTRDLQYVDVYEIMEDRHLKHIATSQQFELVFDVSATAAGEVTVTCQRGERWYLGRATFRGNQFSEWKYKNVESRRQELVSVGGGHVVVAGDDNNNRPRILRVFKEEV